ncbi:DMT family transporter [Streptomyces sp. NPDC048603]|uniref:DMT family transporter n=1 Tax=Streptomyces sp. NPDC048603 TaxID=3365577 RepID=UPI003721A541
MGFVVPVVFALFAACSNALATVLQRRAALTVPQSSGFRPGLFLDLVRQPVWLFGILAVIAAGAGQAAALATGALALVQPLFVLELPLALLIASLFARRPLPGAQWAAVAGVVGGLGVALAALSPTGNRTDVPLDRWIPTLVAGGGAVLALTAAGLRRPPGRIRAVCLGLATALCYALTAALMKSAVHDFDEGGWEAFLTGWPTYGMVVTGISALLLFGNAMQGGPLVASQPALTLGDACTGLLLGVLLYEEQVRGGWWLVPQLAGVALVAAGVLVLARTDDPV